MKYLVAQPHMQGQLSKITIVEGGDQLFDQPFTVWALNDGQRILLTSKALHMKLKSHHMHGAYQNGALYAYTYDELVLVLTTILGDDDFTRLTKLQQSLPKPVDKRAHRMEVAGYIAQRTCGFIVSMLGLCFKVVAFLIILPFVIKWIGKRH